MKIEPALSAEEWEHRRKHGWLSRPASEAAGIAWVGDDLHATAALAMHGEPFGFTWEDVDFLRWILEENPEIATWMVERRQVPMGEVGFRYGDEALNDLIARIEALLPPR